MQGWRCPNCGKTDQLEVAVTVWASLEQTLDAEVNEFQTEIAESDHEWDGDSPMSCTACGWHGIASDAAFTTAPEGCLSVTKGRTT